MKLVETSYNTMCNRWANVIGTKGGSNDCNIDYSNLGTFMCLIIRITSWSYV